MEWISRAKTSSPPISLPPVSARVAILEAAQAADHQTLVTGRDARIQFQNRFFSG